VAELIIWNSTGVSSLFVLQVNQSCWFPLGFLPWLFLESLNQCSN